MADVDDVALEILFLGYFISSSLLKPRHEKTCFFINAKIRSRQPISPFVVCYIVQFPCYQNLKLQASSHLLCLYRPVCVEPDRKPEDRFSRFTFLR